MLAQTGWDSLAKMVAATLPTGPLDSLRQVGWETGDFKGGAQKKVTYYLYQGDGHATAWLWLVERDGRTYINTIQTAPLAANQR